MRLKICLLFAMLIMPLSSILVADGSSHGELPSLDGDLTFEIVDAVIRHLPKYSRESLLEIDRHYDGFQRVVLKEQVKRLKTEIGDQFKSSKFYRAWFVSYYMINFFTTWYAAWGAVRDAARDASAAWNPAWNAAWYAAWNPAWDNCSRDAAGNGSWYAARGAAGHAAMNAARGVAWYAVRGAVGDAAMNASGHAAEDAAGSMFRKILPTLADMGPDQRIQIICHFSTFSVLHWTLSDEAARFRSRVFESAKDKILDDCRIADYKAIIAKHTWGNARFLGEDGLITNPYIGAMKEIFDTMELILEAV